jgi:hypothetical protein
MKRTGAAPMLTAIADMRRFFQPRCQSELSRWQRSSLQRPIGTAAAAAAAAATAPTSRAGAHPAPTAILAAANAAAIDLRLEIIDQDAATFKSFSKCSIDSKY